jgi:hypothetical protein
MATTSHRRRVTVALAALSAGAGAAHASVITDHVAVAWWYGAGFGVVALAQVVWAGLVLRRRPSRRLLAWGAVGHGLVIAIWVLARTAGLPFVPGDSTTAVGVLDATTALFQGLIIAGVLASVAVRLRPRLEQAVGVSAVAVVLLAAPVTVAALAAGPGHSHDALHSHAIDEPHEH